MKNAIVLCSGGLDSVVTAHYVRKKLNYKSITILFFNYGQKSLRSERNSSKLCAKDLKANFREIKILELAKLSASFINNPGKVRKLTKKDLKNTLQESKKWYVPCRNTLFLSYALALAESKFIKNKEISEIFVGFKSEGKEHYPDTTPEYAGAFNNLSRISCTYPFKIKAPLIKMDKEDIINLGIRLGVSFKETFSCYIGKNKHCGICLACRLRKAGFYWSNVEDLTEYIA